MHRQPLPRRHVDPRALTAALCLAPWDARWAQDTPAPPAGSHAVIWHLGGLIVVSAAAGLRVAPKRHAMPKHHVDHYRVVLLQDFHGAAAIGTTPGDGQVARLFLSDLARPEPPEHGALEAASVLLFIPRETLDEALPRPMDLHGLRPRGHAAQMAVEHLRSLVRHLPDMTVQEAPPIVVATTHLLAASILSTPRTPAQPRPPIESTLLRQACRYIDLHLVEPDLTAARIAAFFDISRATLYRVFAPLGGVAHYVRERRLLRVLATLNMAAQPTRIGRLAEAHGFRSTAQFSRAFREQFGCSPTDIRKGHAPRPVPGSPAPPHADDPAAWIRSLR